MIDSRADGIKRLCGDPDDELPEQSAAHYLVDLLFEVGVSVSRGERIAALSWRDLSAWILLSGYRLSYSELSALITLSRAYVDQFYRSQNMNCPSPCVGGIDNSGQVASKFQALFAMMRG